MASKPIHHQIDRTPEYHEFIEKLRAYHLKRGTTLEAEPKAGNIPMDLRKVFNHIVAAGGYDKVSDEKLAWRHMTEELGLCQMGSGNIASVAFSLKEKYYKNLAAFEISTIHGKEPPPKDILEDVTAKGGGLLTRTRENWKPGKRESNALFDSAASGDDGTPSRERPGGEGAGSSSRGARGLREAPPQRVLFQPDTGPTRTRHSSAQHASHTGSPAVNTPPQNMNAGQQHHPAAAHLPPPHSQPRVPRGASFTYAPDPSNMNSSVDLYVPKLEPAVGLRPADTPAANPAMFARRSGHQHADGAGRPPLRPGG